jgi:2-polyprenyl-3-methyl-5-hydroxy-6-metoxy-1,4-benzoquinol methylase
VAKDLFSEQSKIYSQFRPTYPGELFAYILQFIEGRKCAWDCATGNGQAANVLADYFEKVEASDISEAQIKNAVQKANIEYHVCPAEATPFPDNSFDLITVAQAYHWLNWKKFHEEATRVGQPNAVVAVWTYNTLISDNEQLNKLIQHFYRNTVGPYWEHERKYVDNAYATADFDFAPLPSKTFTIELHWTKEQLIGFLETWSSVRKYIKINRHNPVELIMDDLNVVWNEDQIPVRFPIFLRMGRITK